MRIIDLSAPIASTPPDALPYERIEIAYADHAQGAREVERLFQIGPRLRRDGEGWAVELFTRLHTHSVTHVDAPWHYNSRIQGRKSATIDELPLEWFFSDGVVLDFVDKKDGERVTADDIESALAKIGYELKPLDIILIRTGRDAFYGSSDYSRRGCAVDVAATRWLFERGIRVMGIDAWGWDGPLDRQARETLARDEPGIFWASHQADLPYSQIERLVNLAALPPFGYKVACFPLKIQHGSAGPARVVAILAE
jgi:kynurenine formamidase